MLPQNPRLNDTVKLLVGERPERFEFERAIRLFEFQTWIYWPGTQVFAKAGMIAAALLLNSIEANIFLDESDALGEESTRIIHR